MQFIEMCSISVVRVRVLSTNVDRCVFLILHCAAPRRFAWEHRRENRPTLKSLNSGLGHVFCSSHRLRCSLCLDDFNYSAIKLSYAAYALSEIPIWYLLWMLINVQTCVRFSGYLSGNNWWSIFISLKLQISMSDIRFCDVQMTVIWSSPSNLSIIWIILDMYFSMSGCSQSYTLFSCTFHPVRLQLQNLESVTPFLTSDFPPFLTHHSKLYEIEIYQIKETGS